MQAYYNDFATNIRSTIDLDRTYRYLVKNHECVLIESALLKPKNEYIPTYPDIFVKKLAPYGIVWKERLLLIKLSELVVNDKFPNMRNDYGLFRKFCK